MVFSPQGPKHVDCQIVLIINYVELNLYFYILDC